MSDCYNKFMSAVEEQLKRIKREAEEREARRVAEHFGLGYVDLGTMPIGVEALKIIPEAQSRALQIVPIQKKENEVTVAVLTPDNPETINFLKKLEAQQLHVNVRVASLSGLEQAWLHYQRVLGAMPASSGRLDIERGRVEELMRELTSFSAVRKEITDFDIKKLPTNQLLEVVIAGALANRASDVHFEPTANHITVRYRVDGLLHTVSEAVTLTTYHQVLNRIKLLAHIKLNVTHEPQDGRFSVGLQTKEIEVRVSVVPSEFGETVVMRLLDPDAIHIALSDLGLRDDDLAIIQEELRAPNGMILNSGPTGSGKTTTLYAFLRSKNNSELKIVTIEDPIEYHVEGIEQTQVTDEYTFANGLRSLMRQDPDVILVGEIRDVETAEIAVQAALTGHLVFSTVHANDAAGVIPRLLDLGVKPASVGPALNLIIAQRLVRRLCPACKKKSELSQELRKKLQKVIMELPARVHRATTPWNIFEAVGCDLCASTGYRGRVGIYELLRVDPAIEEHITKELGVAELYQLALKQGMVTLQQDGILKVISGITTLKEVEIATGPLII